MVLAFCDCMNTYLTFYGIEFPILSYIGGISFTSWLFIYIAAIVFKFCIYHRLPLHYVAVNARTKETMGSVPIHMPKLFLVSALLEILGARAPTGR